jgi:hypothetical protein
MKTITITLKLEPVHAAALARLCEKFTYEHAAAYLYPHIAAAIRDDQAYQMVGATAVVSKALEDAGVRGFPWIDTGTAK